MRLIAPMFATLCFAAMAEAGASAVKPAPKPAPHVKEVTPQLYDYTTELLFGEVWKRPQLASRDRSLITLSALVSNGQSAQLTGHLNLGLDNGLKPSEISALVTHLAFYGGWPNAMSATSVVNKVFTERKIAHDAIVPAIVEPLTLDADSETKRRAAVQSATEGAAPKLGEYTDDVLFADLWRDPNLTARDRSLATVASLIAQGQVAQLPFHLNRAMENGVTQTEASEVVTHLAFYVGWPKAMSAVPFFREVFEARKKG